MSYVDVAREVLAQIDAGEPCSEVKGRIAAMPLDEFATAGLTLRVWSNVLGCEVRFVSDNVPDAKLEGTDLQIYRTADLRKLAFLRPRPHELRSLNDVKTIFNGVIADVRPRDADSDPAIPESPPGAPRPSPAAPE